MAPGRAEAAGKAAFPAPGATRAPRRAVHYSNRWFTYRTAAAGSLFEPMVHPAAATASAAAAKAASVSARSASVSAKEG